MAQMKTPPGESVLLDKAEAMEASLTFTAPYSERPIEPCSDVISKCANLLYDISVTSSENRPRATEKNRPRALLKKRVRHGHSRSISPQ